MEALSWLNGKGKTSYRGRRGLLRTRLIISFIWVGLLLASSVAIAVSGAPQKWSELLLNHSAAAKETTKQQNDTIKTEIPSDPVKSDITKDSPKAQTETDKAVAASATPKPATPKPATPKAPVNAKVSFKDCAFIGNSITQSLQLFSLAKDADIYAERGIMVSHYDSKAFIKTQKGKITIKQALQKKQYKKVYIMLGMNELGWSYESEFVKKYGILVDGIKKEQPKAKIFIQSVLPVTAEKSEKDKIYNNEKVNRYNALLKQLAEDKKVTFLDVAASLAQADGTLPKEASSDGIHLLKPYCELWVDYLAKNS